MRRREDLDSIGVARLDGVVDVAQERGVRPGVVGARLPPDPEEDHVAVLDPVVAALDPQLARSAQRVH